MKTAAMKIAVVFERLLTGDHLHSINFRRLPGPISGLETVTRVLNDRRRSLVLVALKNRFRDANAARKCLERDFVPKARRV